MRDLIRRRGGGGGSIYEHIRSHLRSDGPGLIEGGATLPDEPTLPGRFRWGGGAMDGVATHHMGVGPDHTQVDTIFRLIGRAASSGGSNIEKLERALVNVETLSIVDPLLERLIDSQIPPRDIESLGRILATTSNSRNAVKLGMSMLGIVRSRDNRDLLMTLGRHDEFTLFSAVALSGTELDVDGALWELAQLVDGWGRIHLVERLRDTKRADIQDWILRDGFRNRVMDEYLAYIAATTGGLTQALGHKDPDGELLDAACDIISALISGGPAEGIKDYAEASHAIELLVGHLEARASTVHHLLAVNRIERYLADDIRRTMEGAETWPPDLRERLRTRCREIVGRPIWANLAVEGMRSDDRLAFWEAERAARIVGIDTLDVHLSRLAADPLEGDWYTVMQIVDEDRIDLVLKQAEASLPLAEIASGPGNELGLGPEYRAHMALSFIVQSLGTHPGRGWPLVAAALRSPVVNNRNMAMNALEAWDRPVWPADTEAALRRAAAIEPERKVRARMQALLDPGDSSKS